MFDISSNLIVFSKEQNEQINSIIDEFTEKMLSSASYYNTFRNSDINKAKRDIFLGKKAEYFALRFMCKKYNYPIIPIDIEIRKSNKKGWECDLPFSKIDNIYKDIHVKSCNFNTLEFCNDFSWTFQYSNNTGKFGKDKIFKKDHNDLVIFVYIDNERSNEGHIKALMEWEDVKNILKLPIKKSLQNIKRCVYYEDIKSLNYNQLLDISNHQEESKNLLNLIK